MSIFVGAYALSRVASQQSRTSASVVQQAETSTPTPTEDPTRFSDPILTAEEAVTRSLAEYYANTAVDPPITPTNVVAKLISIGTLDAWRETSSPLTTPESPAWLVGIVAPGLQMENIVVYVTGPQSARPVEGGYYAWDANSGSLLGIGTLETALAQNIISLDALQDTSIVISAATAIAYPTAETQDDPTPTADDELESP